MATQLGGMAEANKDSAELRSDIARVGAPMRYIDAEIVRLEMRWGKHKT